MDGVAMTTSAAFKWDFIGDPIGEWIQIEFARTEEIGFIRIMEGWYGDNKAIKEVELAFSDGSTQQVKSMKMINIKHVHTDAIWKKNGSGVPVLP